ncbi:MAG TPA: sigma-70 family RNA polymerase sigma factor [Chthoniobacteraceae bacterium]|nr:sigma-70 family RNA polymerase sigma factor [Chthoniobacteraceae bacterium]
MNQVTVLIDALNRGETRAAEDLMKEVYTELRALAARKMSGEKAGHTLQPTALVHEAWLRLAPGNQPWENRAHFFGAAAEAMRRILIDRARRRQAIRHGSGQAHVDILDIEIASPAADDELLAVHEALEILAQEDARKAELVKLRYFAGLSIDEAAEVLGVSTPTAKRDWTFARAWLHREISLRR